MYIDCILITLLSIFAKFIVLEILNEHRYLTTNGDQRHWIFHEVMYYYYICVVSASIQNVLITFTLHAFLYIHTMVYIFL